MEKTKSGWDIEKVANQKVLYSNPGYWTNQGIDITINKKRKSITIGAWYDSCVGIQSQEITLQELINLFK